MTIAIRHAWLQKHPTPAATRGEFHWFPADGDRELRSSYVERMRGLEAPAVLWQLAPGRASWAQLFAATAPIDGRRYAGLVLTIAERDGASAGELLAALELPRAAPWEGEPAAEPGAEARGRPDPSDGEVARIARALLSGGEGLVGDPTGRAFVERVASVERWLPAAVCGRPRAGAWRTGCAPAAPDRVAELVAEVWRDRASRGGQAWRLLCELAAARGRSVDEVAAELDLADAMSALTEAERAAIGGANDAAKGGASRAPRDFAATLHAWGRGRLDASPTAATLPARLADAVALRALACLVTGRDPAAAIAEARWHALLPAARRTALLDAVSSRAASLRPLIERTSRSRELVEVRHA